MRYINRRSLEPFESGQALYVDTANQLLGVAGKIALYDNFDVNSYKVLLEASTLTSDNAVITFPSTTGTVVTTGDSGTITSTMILDGTIVNSDISSSAAIAYSKLALTGTIINADISPSASIAISKLSANTISGISLGNTLNNLSVGSGLTYSSGSAYNGSAATTIAVDTSVIAQRSDTTYVGTTALPLNRASANQALTGILSVTFPGTYSGSIKVQATGAAGTNTITLPATTGTVVTTGDTGTVTSTMILDGTIVNADVNASAAIAYSKLNLSSSIVNADVSSSAAIAYSKLALTGSIVDSDVSATAAIAVSKLAASSITINGNSVTLGGSVNVTATASNTLTFGTGLTGNSYDGSAPVTIAVDTTIIAQKTDTTYVGTTAVALNRSSANQGLTGISSVALPGSTSGTITLQSTAVAGTNTITLPATTGTVVTTGDTGTVTSTMILDGTIVNADISSSAAIAINKLAASAITINGTSTSLGGSITLYAGTTTLQTSSANQGLTGISSIALPGSVSGTITLQPVATAGSNTITLPATTGTVITTGDTGTVTSAMILNGTITNSDVSATAGIVYSKLSLTNSIVNADVNASAAIAYSKLNLTGSIVNADISASAAIAVSKLAASSITINGSSVTLGGSITVTSTASNALTIGTGLTGTSYNGSTAVTIAVDTSIIAQKSDVHYIGTTSVALNRASANLALTGITSVALPGSTSGTITLQPTAIAGTNTLTLPAATDTLVGKATTDTLTNKSIDLTNNTLTATSAQLATALSDETGTGYAVFNTSPSFVTSVTTSSSSFNVFNTTATTVNAFGAATTLNIGASAGTTTIASNVTISGNLTINGTTTTVSSTNTTYTDSLLELHYLNGGTLTSNDGQDIGLRFHYYTTSDKNAALVLANDSQQLEFYVDGTETNGVFSGTYGTFKGAGFNFVGATSGTILLKPTAVAGTNTITLPATTGTVVTTGDTGSITSTMILDGTIVNADVNASAAIAYSKLNLTGSIVDADVSASAAIAVSKLAASTISGVTLGNNLSNLSSGTGLTYSVGSSYNGSAASTLAVDTTVIAQKTDVHYIGTTAVALNRSSANQGLTGITSVALPGSTSGTITLQPTSIAGTNTLTLPAVTGTVVTTGDTGTVTSTMILDGTIVNADINASAAIAVSKLAASTISGVTLGSNLFTLSSGTGLTYSVGSAFNGGAASTLAVDTTVIAQKTDTTYVGTTAVALNRSSANQGLTGITSVALPGSTSGTITLQPTAVAGTNTITLPATTGTVVTTGDTGTVTSTMILDGTIVNADINASAAIAVSKLAASTISGVTLGNNLFTLSSGTGLTYSVGSAFNGSAASTLAVDTTVIAQKSDVHYIGTTSVALNRASANLALTGISSVAFPGSTSGTVTLQPTATAGTTTLTMPATTGTLITTGDTGTVTSTMILDGTIVNADISASAAIAVSKLAASTISGVTLGNNLSSLSAGTGLTYSVGSAFNGGAASTLAVDTTVIAQKTDVHYIGTTSIALNRASASQTLTGVSIDGNAATATTATNATNVGTTNNTTSTVGYVTFVLATSGNNAVQVNSNMTYNASTNVLTTTATKANYADLAECYAADNVYEPGTVLEFGGECEVTVSSTNMSRKIAGVVSTDPAYLMNTSIESEFVAEVALQGRVPCRVQGPVRKGDMMVSAGNGRARAEENPVIGSVIGKALENFNGDTGVIEVVIGRI